MIPKNLNDKHYKAAAKQINRNGVPNQRKSVRYDLEINGKLYPPKYVISLATKFASGSEYPSHSFNAVEAKNYFLHRGYTVIDRRRKAVNTIVSEDDAVSYPEGKKVYKLHRRLERDSSITKKAKAKRLFETRKLQCEVCKHDFQKKYGEIGMGFIEAHHKKPVAKLNGKEATKISDLALVCSNCHRMLHRTNPLMPIEDLIKLIKKVGSKRNAL